MIKVYPDPALEETLADFDTDNPPVDIVELRNEMHEILKTHKGIGLAANQIGLPHRCFVMMNLATNNKIDQRMIAINPVILETEDREVEMWETSLSFPDVKVQITRPYKVHAEWTNVKGVRVNEWLVGYPSRIFQQCLDQLNGVTMKDNVTPAKWKQATNA